MTNLHHIICPGCGNPFMQAKHSDLLCYDCYEFHESQPPGTQWKSRSVQTDPQAQLRQKDAEINYLHGLHADENLTNEGLIQMVQQQKEQELDKIRHALHMITSLCRVRCLDSCYKALEELKVSIDENANQHDEFFKRVQDFPKDHPSSLQDAVFNRVPHITYHPLAAEF